MGIVVYITVTITLLGIAYPILLQVVARLDEKYLSENIVSLFNKEIEYKLFKYSLISSLIFILLWTLKLKPIFQIKGLNFIINNSANIFLAIASIALVVSFFFYVNKILIYYNPTKFIKYLKKRHSNSNNGFGYFEALSDILLLSIRKQQRNLALTLSDFFYTAFKIERDKSLGRPIEYPDLFYEIVHKSIEELAILKEKRNYSLEYSTAGGTWLLGELQHNEISEKTYTWMWRNLVLVVQYQQDDMILYHWQNADQYFSYSLEYIHKEMSLSEERLQISNQKDVDKRLAERERFLEFHYALGGFLTYKKRYDCINRIFNHTHSQPPKYELLPESMCDIFMFYSKIRDPYDLDYTWISHKYYFPGQSGLNADTVVKKWIFSYLGILFLRQYTIVPYLSTMRPLDYPHLPSNQGEIKDWIDGLDFFKQLLFEHLSDKDLLESLSLSFITKQWCEEQGKVFPLDFIDNFKEQLLKKYNENALTLPISNKKIIEFENTTKKIIEDTFERLSIFTPTKTLNGDSDKWYVNGQKMMQSKDAFSENPEIHHMDFDSFLASVLSKRIIEGLSSTFLSKRTKTFLLSPEDIFKAVDKLDINDQCILISFGLDINRYINYYRIPNLSEEKYHNIKIFSYSGNQLVHSSMFIMSTSDIPQISTTPISQDIIEKYSLKKISEKLNLYCSVIDLNSTSEEIFNENIGNKDPEELQKSVLLSIILSTQISWKKNVDIIHFMEYSHYRQQGIQNTINDIVQIKKPSR